jgi:hypothetical protein
MRGEMHRHGKMFWDWSAQEWIDTLCPTPALFDAKYGRRLCAHMTVMDAAYLLGALPAHLEQLALAGFLASHSLLSVSALPPFSSLLLITLAEI